MIIEHEYVKHSLSLTWAFFSKNIISSSSIIFIFSILTFLSSFPIIGIFTLMLLSVLSFSVQVFIAKVLVQTEDDTSFFKVIQESSFSDVLLTYVKIGVGALFGQVLIELLLTAIFYIAFSSIIGMDVYEAITSGTLAKSEILTAYMKIGFVASIALLILMAWIYIVPMMLAFAYEAKTPWEAFFAAFVIFSTPVWKASFKEKYYVLMSMLQVIAMSLISLIFVYFTQAYLLPLFVFLTYLFLIYLAVVSTMAKEAVI